MPINKIMPRLTCNLSKLKAALDTTNTQTWPARYTGSQPMRIGIVSKRCENFNCCRPSHEFGLVDNIRTIDFLISYEEILAGRSFCLFILIVIFTSYRMALATLLKPIGQRFYLTSVDEYLQCNELNRGHRKNRHFEM